MSVDIERMFREWCKARGLPDNIPVVVTPETTRAAIESATVDGETLIQFTPGTFQASDGTRFSGFEAKVVRVSPQLMEAMDQIADAMVVIPKEPEPDR